ncbi:MAG: NfeD family protein [Nodosilinea sp.]
MPEEVQEDFYPEAESPQEIQWAGDAADEPTFPEGAWTDKTAVVETPLEGQHKSQVKFEGVYWTAIATHPGTPLTPGDTVAILGRDGNELIVQTLPQAQPTITPPAVVTDPQDQPLSPDPTDQPLRETPPPNTLV